MEQFGSFILLLIVSFCLAFVILLKRDSIPERLRRPLAIFAIFMVGSSFIMFVIALYLP